MTTKELIQQVRHIEIKTKGLVNQLFSGEYHSVFKGRGMEFSEVREYQPGDDVRNIDWNVTARYGHPFVKVFEEERELTVMLLVDMSGSQQFGTHIKTKQQVAAEISAILAFSALKNNDKVGLILFSDKIEKFVPPRKGKTHALRIVRDVLSFEPGESLTDLRMALEYFNHTVKKRSIAFLISDFIDDGFGKILKIVGRKHDLIAVELSDSKEREIPEIGLADFIDAETGEIITLDTSETDFRKWFEHNSKLRKNNLAGMFRSGNIDTIPVDIDRPYVKSLIDFFKQREKR